MRLVALFLLVLLLGGCDRQAEPVETHDILPKQVLVKVLIDLEIMEAYYEQTHKRPQIYKTTLDSASRQILTDNGVTEEELMNTLVHYSDSPDSLYSLYEQALDSINSLVIQNKKLE